MSGRSILRAHAVLHHDADTVWRVVRDAGHVADWFPAAVSPAVAALDDFLTHRS